MGHAIRLTKGTCTRLAAAVATMTAISTVTGGAHTLSSGSVAPSQRLLKPLRSWLRDKDFPLSMGCTTWTGFIGGWSLELMPNATAIHHFTAN